MKKPLKGVIKSFKWPLLAKNYKQGDRVSMAVEKKKLQWM